MKRSLLIVVGAGSDVAQHTIPELRNFDDLMAFSRLEGQLKFAGSLKKFFTYSSDDSIEHQISQVLPSKSEISRLGFISFTGIKDRSLLVQSNELQMDDLLRANINVPATFARTLFVKYLGIRSNFVFISSSGALAGAAGAIGYSASKHALSGLSRGISIEYGKLGVVSNCLALGLLELGMGKNLSERQKIELLHRTATHRAVTEQSVITSLEFLLNAEDITGSTLYCDGGFH